MTRTSIKRAAAVFFRIAGGLSASLPKCAARRSIEPAAEGMASAFEDLGPAFIKLGQFLSVRPDLAGPVVASGLERLRDRAAPLDPSVVERIIREELGGGPEELFARFDRVPIASASVSQVHRAATLRGEEIVLKIQRPEAAGMMEADLAILESLARLLSRLGLVPAFVDPVAFIGNIKLSAKLEMDFRREAETAERFALFFRGDQRIKIPRVHWEFTTGRILAAEFVEGLKINDPAAKEAPGYISLAETGAFLFMKQVLEGGLFHADLHPSNLFITPGGKIAYLDFGICGELDNRERAAVMGVLAAMLAGERKRALENLALLGVEVPPGAEDGFSRDVEKVMKETLGEDLGRTNTAKLGLGFLAAVRAHGVRLPHKYALLIKALLTIEGAARTLHPGFDMREAARAYAGERFLREMGLAGLLEAFMRTALWSASMAGAGTERT